MANLYEYYNTGDDSSDYFQSNWWSAQTFTPATAHKITSVKLKLFKVNSPGEITVSIRATDVSGHPTGEDLCSGTTNGNSLPTTSPYEWREIMLGEGCNLDADTKYAIVARALGGDSSNYVNWRRDGSSPTYAGGLYLYSNNNGGSWTPLEGSDAMFEDWGEAIAPPVAGRSYGFIIG